MLKTMKNALKVKEIRKKLLFTLGILIVFRLGTYITVPGINAKALETVASTGLVSILNTFSGGGLTNYSILAMGVSPYITAQIVVQLLQMDIVPRFVEWSKQGEVGRRKLNQVTRYLTIVLAFVQSIGITAGFNALSGLHLIERPSLSTYLMIGIILTAGTMFTTWLGDMITDRGIGNGVSIIIMAGILARTPSAIHEVVKEWFGSAPGNIWVPVVEVVALVVAVLIIVVFVTYVEEAKYRVPIQYTRRMAGTSDNSFLPLKVNVAGVIPVIFASSFIATPQTILMAFTSKFQGATWFKVATDVFNMQTVPGMTLYTILIIVFTFFYAFVQVNPEKLAENLQKQGSYIPSVWPGKETQKYVSRLLMRLSSVGALFLGFVSLIPLVASAIFGLNQSIGLGGTSLLIVVGVTLDTVRQMEGMMMKRKYVGFIRE